MSMLAELDAAALPRERAPAPPRFADVLAKVLGRPRDVSEKGGAETVEAKP
jgi:hypothetical protein